MKKINTFALTAILAICFVFPMNAHSQLFVRYAGSGRTQQTTNNQAVATTCSQSSLAATWSAAFVMKGAGADYLGASWNAAFQMVAMMLSKIGRQADRRGRKSLTRSEVQIF